MDEISEKDFTTVVELLTAAELQKLYEALNISYRDSEKAEIGASTSDVNLKAKAVLRQWKQNNGRLASRQAILDAVHECGNLEAEEKLTEKWTGKGK